MRRALLLAVLVVGGLWVGAGSAGATNECNGFPACVSVPGPWVPLAGRTGAHASWDLKCPDRFIVGGIDALVSDRAIDVGFHGMVGGPVAPGLATGQDALISGTYTGAARRASAFKPFIGCIPTSGGGGRETTAYHANPPKVYPVGRPTVRRAAVVHLRSGLEGAVKPSCAPKERLVSVDAAAGFYTTLPPPAAAAAAVRVAVVGQTVRISVGDLPAGVRADVQVVALCAGA